MELRGIRAKIKWYYDRGMVHIMGSGFLSKVFTFIGNVCVTHMLTKEAYGFFSAADNIMSFFLIMNGLGVCGGILQYGSEDRPEEAKKAYYRFGLALGLMFNSLLCVLVLLYWGLVPFSISGVRPVFLLYALYPITYFIYQYFGTVLRCKRENKGYARLMNLNAAFYAVGEVVGAHFVGVAGIVYALYLGTIVASIVGIKTIKTDSFRTEKRLSAPEKSGVVKYSLFTCMNTTISNLLIMFDVFLITYMIADAATVSSYKIGTTIPLALIFIPNSIIMFVYPYFASHNRDRRWFAANARKLYKYTFAMNLLIAAALFILAPLIIRLLWGERYMDSVAVFRILSVEYLISATFRVNSSSLLATMRKVKANLYINLVSGVVNVVLDYLMIRHFGYVGAAWATLIVVAITSAMLLPTVVKSIRELPEA